MIVVTDGESHDSPDLQRVIEDSEDDDIIRYAIAVSLPCLGLLLSPMVSFLPPLYSPCGREFAEDGERAPLTTC